MVIVVWFPSQLIKLKLKKLDVRTFIFGLSFRGGGGERGILDDLLISYNKELKNERWMEGLAFL